MKKVIFKWIAQFYYSTINKKLVMYWKKYIKGLLTNSEYRCILISENEVKVSRLRKEKEMVKGTKYTEKELYAFVWRADTPEKIEIAKKWLIKNVEDNDIWNDLMVALSIQSRNYYRAQDGRPLI